MAVVFHRSAGKMILKSLVSAIVFSVAWIKSVAGGTSYSNVYMQSGPRLATFYGPAALRSAQLAPIAASPLMSSLIPPCVSPCVIPSQQVAALTPVATSNANFVSYKSPISVPVVVAPANDDGTSYEYSYVVYDEDTGDQKAQKESSDGSVVRGQYSLIQPDGYIREVQYTADDLRGFNAVVKNFLPEEEVKLIPPCPEITKEPLKDSPKGESQEKAVEAHDLEPEAHEEAHKEEHTQEESPEGQDHAEGENHGKNKEPAEPKHGELEEHAEPEKHEELVEPEKTEIHEEPKGHEEPVEHKESEGHEKQAEPVDEHGESKEPKHEEQVSPVEHAEPENHEESHAAEEHGSEEKKKEEPRSAPATEVQMGDISPLVSYNDVIKCLQSAIKGVNMGQPSASPLTYIILNKPC